MELIEPAGPSPALLLLGHADSTRRLLSALCQEVGVLLDEARCRQEAFAKFLERGGHEVVIVADHEDQEMMDTVLQLMEIDPDLLWFDLSGDLDEDTLEQLEAQLQGFESR